MIRIGICALAAVIVVAGCDSGAPERRAASAPAVTTRSTSRITPSTVDPCEPTAQELDPCYKRQFWLDQFDQFDSMISDAITALSPPYSPATILAEANSPASYNEDPLGGAYRLRDCLASLRFIGKPPELYARRGDAASFAAYSNACPKFEAAAAVFITAFGKDDPQLITGGQRLLREGEAMLCEGGLHCGTKSNR